MRVVLLPAYLLGALVLSAFWAADVAAQEQQAGNEASTNAEETFQQLIEQCDDVDVLTLRARFRLAIQRTTEEARQEAQPMFDQGMAQCGEGDIEAAKTTLQQALDIASAGAQQIFEAQEAAAAQQAAADANASGATSAEAGGADMVTLGGLAVLLAGAAFYFMRRRSG